MAFSWDDLNPFSGDGLFSGSRKSIPGRIITPGAEAEKQAQAATNAWKDLAVPDQANLGFGTDINPYEAGNTSPLGTPGAEWGDFGGLQPANYTDPTGAFFDASGIKHSGMPGGGTVRSDVAGPGVQGSVPTKSVDPYDALYGDSAAANNTNAFDGLTSAWGPQESAFTGTESAAKDLTFDAGAEQGLRSAQGYFSDLSQSGHDPIADAYLERNNALAEGKRRGNVEAALSALETKGMGNAGGALSARLSGGQDSANAQHQAALDATAMAAARRSLAAKTGADVSHVLGTDMAKVAADKAAATDKYNFYKLSGMDETAAKKASGLDAFETNKAQGTNAFQGDQDRVLDAWGVHKADQELADKRAALEREHATSDKNTDLRNQTNTFNTVTAPQQRFANDVTKTGGVTTGLNNQGKTSLAGNEALVGNVKSIAGAVSGIPAGGGGGGAPAYSSPAQPGAAPFTWPSATPVDPNAKPKFYA